MIAKDEMNRKLSSGFKGRLINLPFAECKQHLGIRKIRYGEAK